MHVIAVTELQGYVSELTLYVVSINTTSNSSTTTIQVLEIAADISEVIVTGVEPDTLYSASLTVTVHGGHNITSDSAIVRTTSGG